MRVLVLLTIVFLFAACSVGGGDGAAIEAGELEELVLQPDDLPEGYVQFDEGRQLRIEERFDAERFARLGGWKARYRRQGTRLTDGPLVVASLVDAFESNDGAEGALETFRSDLGRSGLGWRPVEDPELGDEAVALTAEQGSGSARVTFVVVAWREANVAASVEVNGFAGRTEVSDALELAEKQAGRIERAAS